MSKHGLVEFLGLIIYQTALVTLFSSRALISHIGIYFLYSARAQTHTEAHLFCLHNIMKMSPCFWQRLLWTSCSTCWAVYLEYLPYRGLASAVNMWLPIEKCFFLELSERTTGPTSTSLPKTVGEILMRSKIYHENSWKLKKYSFEKAQQLTLLLRSKLILYYLYSLFKPQSWSKRMPNLPLKLVVT